MPRFEPPKDCIAIKAPADLRDFVTSRKDNTDWLWIRIPKTATISYRTVFFPDVPRNALQTHRSWWDLDEDEWTKGFTVVRHPMSRFKSAIGHIGGLKRAHMQISFRDTEDLVEFFEPIVPVLNRDIEDLSPTWVKKTFKPRKLVCPNCKFYVPTFISALFMPQMYWAYNPKVRFFKYEELDTFNEFIEQELGYDTSTLGQANKSKTDLSHIDFEHPAVEAIVDSLYGVDFDVFEYGRKTKSKKA